MLLEGGGFDTEDTAIYCRKYYLIICIHLFVVFIFTSHLEMCLEFKVGNRR